MKNFSLIILVLFFCNQNYSQVAVIKNTDGFINVKKEPKSTSETIYKLKDSEVFVYQQTEIDSDSDWRTVFISKNKYQLESVDTYDKYMIGYIPKDLIYSIEYLPEEYLGAHFYFKYTLEKFNPKNKIIDYTDKKISVINGRKIYGTNGNTPKTEVVEIAALINGKSIEIPNILYEDIFECDNDFKVYKNKEDYIVYQWNGYGPTEYLIVWVFGNEKLKQRLILKP